MPYYIGDVITDETKLVARTPEKFRESGIDVRINTAVQEIDTRKGLVRLSDNTALPYDTLALGTGTKALTPGIPGEALDGVFLLKKLTDALRMKQYIREVPCRKAVIIGAGFIGLEMCEAFRTIGVETVVVHRGALPANRWDPELAKVILAEMEKNGVAFLTERQPLAIEHGRDYRLCLTTDKGNIETDLILMAVGVRPDSDLAAASGLPLGKTGAIQVDVSQKTALESIYAVGDCCEVFHRVSRKWVNIPLGDIANKQGRVAGRNIGGGTSTMPGIVGAQSFRLFHLECAATGIDEREATAAGFNPASTIVWGNAIAGPMPGQRKVGIKLTADRTTGKLLGAQAVGEIGAVSRINTLSAVLWSGITLDELGFLDLAYAPPFSGSWDPIHIAAQGLAKKL